MSDKFGKEVIILTKIYTSNENNPGVYCDTLVKYLNNHAKDLKEVKDPYHNSNILHLLASNDPYKDMANDIGMLILGACRLLPCKELNHIIHETIVCIKNNLETLNVFLEAMRGKTTEKNFVDMTSKIPNKTPMELMNNYDVTKKITVGGNEYNIKKTLEEIFNRIDPKSAPITTPNPSTVPATVPATVPVPVPAPVPSTVPAPVPSTVPAHTNIIPINKNKEELAGLITTILKGLNKSNSKEIIIKGGAPDDGLATLIVSILNALSNKEGDKKSLFSSLKLSMPSFSFGTKKDDFDILLNDIIDIILNIANGEQLPTETEPGNSTMKNKLLSGLGNVSGMFKGLMSRIPSGPSILTAETEKYVPVSNKKCEQPTTKDEPNPIAMDGEKCIDDGKKPQ